MKQCKTIQIFTTPINHQPPKNVCSVLKTGTPVWTDWTVRNLNTAPSTSCSNHAITMEHFVSRMPCHLYINVHVIAPKWFTIIASAIRLNRNKKFNITFKINFLNKPCSNTHNTLNGHISNFKIQSSRLPVSLTGFSNFDQSYRPKDSA
jgi:hypothetical protein